MICAIDKELSEFTLTRTILVICSLGFCVHLISGLFCLGHMDAMRDSPQRFIIAVGALVFWLLGWPVAVAFSSEYARYKVNG